MEDESLRLGPNGGLVFCMEYLASNPRWLEESLGHLEDDYVLFDCPGTEAPGLWDRLHKQRTVSGTDSAGWNNSRFFFIANGCQSHFAGFRKGA